VAAFLFALLTMYALRANQLEMSRWCLHGSGLLAAIVWFLLWHWYYGSQIRFEKRRLAPRLNFDPKD
jgi:hypothetical protein